MFTQSTLREIFLPEIFQLCKWRELQQPHFIAADTGVSLDHCMVAVMRENTRLYIHVCCLTAWPKAVTQQRLYFHSVMVPANIATFPQWRNPFKLHISITYSAGYIHVCASNLHIPFSLHETTDNPTQHCSFLRSSPPHCGSPYCGSGWCSIHTQQAL